MELQQSYIFPPLLIFRSIALLAIFNTKLNTKVEELIPKCVVVGIEQGKIHGAVYILFAYRREELTVQKL